MTRLLLFLLLACLAPVLPAAESSAPPTPPASTPAGPRPAWAADAGRDEYGLWADLTVEGVTQRLRWITPGTFLMGSPRDEADRHEDEVQHQVTLSRGFWLADTELTQAFYQAVTQTKPTRAQGGGQHPITQVSWDQCQKFLARLNELKPGLGAKLPTEAQWEYACRAGTTGPTYDSLDASAWYALNSRDRYNNWLVHPVRQKQPNPWGLYDMLGNVWELCADFHGDYPRGPVTDPLGPSTGRMRVERGGSYSSAAGACRAAWRWGSESKSARPNLDFRLAAQPPQP